MAATFLASESPWTLDVDFLQVKLQDQTDGYEFSIKTPVTPARWQDYNEVRPTKSALPYLPLLLHARLHACRFDYPMVCLSGA